MILILCVLLCFLSICSDAHAYLDGGTGSMIAQILLGGFAVAGAFIKMYWYKFKSIFKRK
jgi:hypothetical protein